MPTHSFTCPPTPHRLNPDPQVLSGHSHSYERSLLVRGHYLSNTTWSPDTMLVDGGLGTGQQSYTKPGGRCPSAGFVAVVAGSSSRCPCATWELIEGQVALWVCGAALLKCLCTELQVPIGAGVG